MPPPAAVQPFRGLPDEASLLDLATRRAFWGRTNATTFQTGKDVGKVVQASVLVYRKQDGSNAARISTGSVSVISDKHLEAHAHAALVASFEALMGEQQWSESLDALRLMSSAKPNVSRHLNTWQPFFMVFWRQLLTTMVRDQAWTDTMGAGWEASAFTAGGGVIEATLTKGSGLTARILPVFASIVQPPQDGQHLCFRERACNNRGFLAARVHFGSILIVHFDVGRYEHGDSEVAAV
jgi:hypothetical protein